MIRRQLAVYDLLHFKEARVFLVVDRDRINTVDRAGNDSFSVLSSRDGYGIIVLGNGNDDRCIIFNIIVRGRYFKQIICTRIQLADPCPTVRPI